MVSFLKFLITTCFGLYGHHHVLKLLYVPNCCASDVLVQVICSFFRMRSQLWVSVIHSDGPLSLCVALCALVAAFISFPGRYSRPSSYSTLSSTLKKCLLLNQKSTLLIIPFAAQAILCTSSYSNAFSNTLQKQDKSLYV